MAFDAEYYDRLFRECMREYGQRVAHAQQNDYAGLLASTQAGQLGEAQKAYAQALFQGDLARVNQAGELVPADCEAPAVAKRYEAKTWSLQERPEGVTASDQSGHLARFNLVDNPEKYGCRLGCACKMHKPVKQEPWVPSVTDWDLLKDA